MKHRIIPVVLYDGTTVVKGKTFRNDRTIGSVEAIANLYAKRRPDEILFLDITATGEDRSPNFEIFEYFASKFDVPFGVGGGIKTVRDAKRCISNGAEKIVLGTIAAENPTLITEISNELGSQAVVVSIDTHDNFVFKCSGKVSSGKRVLDFVQEVEKLGAGEILLQDITRDGTLKGLNLNRLIEVLKVTKIPVIVSGGVGKQEHFLEAFRLGASGVGAGAFFQFTQFTPNQVAWYLKGQGLNVRTQSS